MDGPKLDRTKMQVQDLDVAVVFGIQCWVGR